VVARRLGAARRWCRGDGSWDGQLDPWLRQKVPFGDLLERWLPTWQDLAAHCRST
jgi:hypothetical protein